MDFGRYEAIGSDLKFWTRSHASTRICKIQSQNLDSANIKNAKKIEKSHSLHAKVAILTIHSNF
ncbi:hypothetical protein HFN_0383 [Helicobacter fennelliae MRY12-0050]|uniref:Uncharacterized protein n=1 Tax=Helicobacter fennelliae MRY12-0050 TaxID=1325130 RepID=T1DW96_9HELI|nr:hypothetical protein HFN_0383 [Helicobacter fennelliae MRY12-0050]